MITEQEYKSALKVIADYENEQKENPENMVKFNINQYVYVMLNESGYEAWVNSYEDVPKHLRPTLRTLKDRTNAYGYVRFQMWEFMQIFGKTISMCQMPFFATDILFEKDSIKEATEC